MTKLSSILAIGAHPDDIELGCGGSLAKFIRNGVRVRALVLSKGDVGNRYQADRLLETKSALELLGITDIHTVDFPDTRMHQYLSEIIACIEEHVRAVQPDRVYTMFKDDRHQDHRTTYEASIVACRWASQILCYETPSSWPDFQPQVFEEIGDTLDIKIQALALHESQRDRKYTQPEAMRIGALFHGQQIGIGAAEGFIGYKIIL